MESRGNLPLAILAGFGAALVGAFLWMGVTIATGLHVGYVALAIGALVGMAVRVAGKGSTPVFGVIGAALTLLGCLAGEILTRIEFAAGHGGQGFFGTLPQLDLGKLTMEIVTGGSPITYFIYAIGVYEGYKLAILKPVSDDAPR